MSLLTTKKQFAIIGALAIATALFSGSAYVYAQDEVIITAENSTTGEPVPVVTTTDALLGQASALMAAIAGIITTVGTIIAVLIGFIRSKTGDKIISKDVEDKYTKAFAQIQQKDNELRDVFRQVLEQKEKINAFVDIVKTTNPEIVKKYESEVAPVVSQKLSEVQTQVNVWQKQADDFYSNVLGQKKPEE